MDSEWVGIGTPPVAPVRAIATLNSKALMTNYEAVSSLAGDQGIIPMVKANAYGHGAGWVARQLMHLNNLYAFGVSTAGEGAELREALGARGRRTRIIVFSGASPWSDSLGFFCEKYCLIPVVVNEEDWQRFLKGGWPKRLQYELKFNTGMNRLGLPMSALGSVVRALKNMQAPIQHPSGIMSHLAMAESPDSRISRMQLDKFMTLKKVLSPLLPSARFHLGNSAAIWNKKSWSLDGLTDLVRPGISLYGVTPWDGAPVRGIEPVMTIKAAVLAVHSLKHGESVGYGATYKITGDKKANIAVVGAGYADGVMRALGNKGYAWINGRLSRFAGTVSMDLSTVVCSSGTKVGEWVEILGPHIDPWRQAKEVGTIPYEFLTAVSSSMFSSAFSRVERIYD
ncbi:MAG: alanine racemase [Bdellovibrionota bacterium]